MPPACHSSVSKTITALTCYDLNGMAILFVTYERFVLDFTALIVLFYLSVVVV